MRAEIKSLLLGSPLSLLTYLRIGNITLFPGEGLESYALRSDMYLFVCWFVRSFVR